MEGLTTSSASCDGLDRFVGIHDSKQLSAPQREAAARLVRDIAVAVGVGVVPPLVVDEMGLALAGQLAFWRAVENLGVQPEHLLVDGFPLWAQRFAQTAVIHGDARCLSIAAASVIAKVTRDGIMADLDAEIPGYGFCSNRGYGTRRHAAALRELGPTAHHRRSYAPVTKCLLSPVDD
jgi:ribonuclease HII